MGSLNLLPIQERSNLGLPRPPPIKLFPFLVANQTKFATERLQTLICVVVPEHQTMLRPRRKHSVGLVYALCDQVIDEDADVRITAIQLDRWTTQRSEPCIDSRDQSLAGSLLVTCRPVDLTCQKEALDAGSFEERGKLLGIDKVIFNGIAGSNDLRFVKTRNRFDQLLLQLRGREVENPRDEPRS